MELRMMPFDCLGEMVSHALMGGKSVGGRDARGLPRAYYWELPQWSTAGRRGRKMQFLYQRNNEILVLAGWGHPRAVRIE